VSFRLAAGIGRFLSLMANRHGTLFVLRGGGFGPLVLFLLGWFGPWWASRNQAPAALAEGGDCRELQSGDAAARRFGCWNLMLPCGTSASCASQRRFLPCPLTGFVGSATGGDGRGVH